MTPEEYVELMLDGAGMTDETSKEYTDSVYVDEVTKACALGAAMYAHALRSGFDTVNMRGGDFAEAAGVIWRRYNEVYDTYIQTDNDLHGRDYTIKRVKELL